MNQSTLACLAAACCLCCFMPTSASAQPRSKSEGPDSLVQRYLRAFGDSSYTKLNTKRVPLERAVVQLLQKRTRTDSNFAAIGYYLLANDDMLYQNGPAAHASIQTGMNIARHDSILGALWQLDAQLATDLLNDLPRIEESTRRSVAYYEAAGQYHEATRTQLNFAYSLYHFNLCSRGFAQIGIARAYFERHKAEIPPKIADSLVVELSIFSAYVQALCHTCRADSFALMARPEAKQDYEAARGTLTKFAHVDKARIRGVVNHALARVQVGLGAPASDVYATLDSAYTAFLEGEEEQEQAMVQVFKGWFSITQGNLTDSTVLLQGLSKLLGYTVRTLAETPDPEYFSQPAPLNLHYLGRAYQLKAEAMRALYETQGDTNYLRLELNDLKTALAVARAQQLIVTDDEALYAINYRFAPLYQAAAEVAIQLLGDGADKNAPSYIAGKAAAWDLVQHSKEYTLRQAALRMGNTGKLNGMEAIEQKDSALRGSIRNTYKEYLIARNDAEKTDRKKKYRQAGKIYFDFVTKLSRGTPEERQFYRERRDDFTVSIDSVADALGRGQTLLEYYFLPQNRLAVFICTPEGESDLRVLDLGLDISPVCRLINALASGNDETRLTELAEKAHQLYTWVLEPVRDKISGHRLLVCPDRELAAVPFDILVDTLPAEQDQQRDLLLQPATYLIKDFALSYDYSASLHRQAVDRDYSAKPYRYNWAGFAPFSADIPAGLQVICPDYVRRMIGTPISATASEIKTVKSMVTGSKEVFIGTDASLTTFLSVCSSSRYLHLATHGAVRSGDTEASFVLFYMQPPRDTGILRMRDIYQIPIPAEMVVLSACETLAGDWREGEGFFSLTRAFSLAGAKSVVASRWLTSDRATEPIIKAFYANLLNENMPKDIAMQQAKLNNGEDFSPFYWSGFSVVGNTNGY